MTAAKRRRTGGRAAPATSARGAAVDSVPTCVFTGPSLHGEPTPDGMSRYGPVALGSVFRAVEAGYRRIGIVDGVFGNLPAVWHKEILYAMSEGAWVAGAASMGALRAAELHSLGMTGIGRIYRLFASGLWSDDDEVAVLHAPQDLGFRPVSDAMANIRFTLRHLRRRGLIGREDARALAARMKALHFSERTAEALRREATVALGPTRATPLLEAYSHHYVDVKGDDARALLRRLALGPTIPAASRPHAFRPTRQWRSQFERQLADVPPLR